MFENYAESKRSKGMTWAIGLVVLVVAGHAVAGTALLVKSMWDIKKLDVPGGGVDLAIAPPPPPPPPLKGGKRLETQKKVVVKKVKVTETVQPVNVKPDDKPAETSDGADGPPDGDPDGDENGDPNGVAGGVSTEAPPPPPPPPPQPPQIVPPTAFDQQRVSGDKNIFPDDVTKTEISRSGKTQLIIPVKVCVSRAGNIDSVQVLKSSGFAAYDEKLKREIKRWKYNPFMINGSPAPVCSIVQFMYRQK